MDFYGMDCIQRQGTKNLGCHLKVQNSCCVQGFIEDETSSFWYIYENANSPIPT